jgi:hypothetical protein
MSDMRQYTTALNMYMSERGTYPICPAEYIDGDLEFDVSTAAALTCLHDALVPKYLSKLMGDPHFGNNGVGTWGDDYNYSSNGSRVQLRTTLETAYLASTGAYPGQPAGYCGVSASLPVCSYYETCVYKGYGPACRTGYQYGVQ